MSKSYEDVVRLKKSLEDDYRGRHNDLKLLRDYYHGRFWSRAEADSRGISSVFRDLTSKSSDVGPDIKAVQPIVWEIVTKYQTFLSPVPQCRTYVDTPESPTRRAQATKKERFIYGAWSESRLPKKLAKVGFYLPLMGDCFLGIFPDFDNNIPRMLVRSPEKAYPIPDTEEGLAGVIFADEIRESQATRQYPKYVARGARAKNIVQRVMSGVTVGVPRESDPVVEVLEYSDGECFYRWIDGIEVAGVEHKLGFNLFDQVSFIHVPDEPWGHGAVEQYIGLNELQNALYSLIFQGMLDNIFPHLVLEDPSKAPELIDKGPGSVLPLNPGGKAYYLSPPVQTLQVQEGFMNLNDHNIRRGAGMPGITMGDSPTSSIATGKAINELQGAATGSTIEMVQGVGIGTALVSWNEKAIVMAQKMFREDTINLFGVLPSTHIEINPQQFALTLKGKDLVGSPRNEVVFSPHLSDHEKLVMGLQGLGAGLWSKKYIREQMGIPDNEAMVEEIVGEVLEDGVIGAIVQAFQQEPTPEGAVRAEGQADAFIGGLPSPAPHPLLSAGAGPATGAGPSAPPAGAPQEVGPLGTGGGQAVSKPFRLPPGSPPPEAPMQTAPQAPQAGSGAVTENEVAAAFAQLQGLKGKVFLVGEIVAQGQTSGDIEVSLTDDDRDAIAAGLPQYAARFIFHHVQTQPTEQFVEVTPGSPSKRGEAPQEALVA